MQIRRRKYVVEALVFALLFGLLLWRQIPSFIKAQNALTPHCIPDPVFRNYLTKQFRGSLTAAEAAQFKGAFQFGREYGFDDKITPERVEISTLKGIEFFTNLRTLQLCNSQVAEIDLSKNANLKKLILTNNPIAHIDLSNLSNLQELEISNVSHLDVSKNSQLERLDIYAYHQADSINLRTLIGLKELSLNFNECEKLTLDFSGNPVLETLTLTGVVADRIDFSPLKHVKNLRMFRTKVSKLDVSQNPNLEKINFSECESAPELDVSNHPRLTWVYCNKSNLTRLILKGCTALEQVDCEDNLLTELDFSDNPKMKYLFMRNNNLTAIPDVGNLSDFQRLDLRENPLGADDLNDIRNLRQRLGFPKIDPSDNRLMAGFACVPVKGATDRASIEALVREGETPVDFPENVNN